MKRWVVTGPAGGGKSVLCGMLANKGAAVLDGDLLGHEILTRPEVVAAIVEDFGRQVVGADGVDRAALGQVVFAEPGALRLLNKITHGPLSALADRRLEDLAREGRHPLAVLEAAVYFLLPPLRDIDLVITVTATETTRFDRLTERAGLDTQAARFRIEAQRHLERDWGTADVILQNDGPRSELATAAEKLWARLRD